MSAPSVARITPEAFLRIWQVHEVCLSPRQREIAKLFMRGYSVKEIADKLSLAENTVGAHRTKMFLKMDVGSTTELLHALYMRFANDYASFVQ